MTFNLFLQVIQFKLMWSISGKIGWLSKN